ncbi:54S ribosomal protein L37, mitochondrial [Smittium culicis]|uniref:Large ribosomal subunit protein mL54 n=1 Tax=Smittium culicis TaxID=133412 RepID=A0A1R1X2E7_9FUNG|nr:54S ribosomal protein L37, mitochondrial [Smittium culicis]OMJ20868.1 54S ribosomal protein L37, mitochondrial [Smittium culicis]
MTFPLPRIFNTTLPNLKSALSKLTVSASFRNLYSTNVKSSVAKGTVLKGINYKVDQPEIIAMEDSEYPDWLWKLLDQPTSQDAIPERVALKIANKKLIKQGNFLKSKKK